MWSKRRLREDTTGFHETIVLSDTHRNLGCHSGSPRTAAWRNTSVYFLWPYDSTSVLVAALARPVRPPDVPQIGRPITCDNGTACAGGVQRCVGRGGSEWGRAAPAHPCVTAMALHESWRRVCPAGFVPPGVSVLPGPLSGGGGYLESLFYLVGQGSAPTLCAHIRSTGTSQRGGSRLH